MENYYHRNAPIRLQSNYHPRVIQLKNYKILLQQDLFCIIAGYKNVVYQEIAFIR